MSRVVALLLKDAVLARWLAFGLEQQHYLVLTPAGTDDPTLQPGSPALAWQPDLWLVSSSRAAEFRKAQREAHRREQGSQAVPWRLVADGGQSEALADEVVWPSEPRALLLQLHQFFAAAVPDQPVKLAASGLRLDVPAQLVWVGAQPVPVSPQALRLLNLLLQAPGQVFSRSQLLDALWQEEGQADERSIDVLVYRLRRQLAAAGMADLLESVRGRGYRLCLRSAA